MANGNLDSLYQAVSNQFDIGTWEDFSTKMQTPEDRKSFFDAVSMQFDIGSYEEFESKLGGVEIEPNIEDALMELPPFEFNPATQDKTTFNRPVFSLERDGDKNNVNPLPASDFYDIISEE